MRLQRFILLLLAFFASPLAAAKPQIDPKLVGSWGQNGETVYLFKSDGTGSMEGDSFRWSSDGQTLTLSADEEEKIRYQIKDNQLTFKVGIFPLTFQRIAKAQTVKTQNSSISEPQTGKIPAQKEPDGKDNLSQLLLSSPWCSFSYSKVSGATNTKRVTFFQNGTWSDTSRYEGYSSGYAGSVASQHDSGNGGRWKVDGSQLYMSDSESALSPVNLQVKKNSNGHPILVADGVEYSQCR